MSTTQGKSKLATIWCIVLLNRCLIKIPSFAVLVRRGGGAGHSNDTAKKRVPISHHVWHDKDLYLLNDRRYVEYRPKFCGLIEKKVNVNRYI